jgi:indole-3-glycerol phosphate synthase
MGILETICDERKADAARNRRERPPSSLERSAGLPRPSFAPRLQDGASPLLIAECKKASPSRGLLVEDYDPVALASAYERGGAGMLSVLTEPRRFLGADEHLRSVRSAVKLPVLRKDFTIDPYQVLEAWSIGADAILLIAAALSEAQLLELAAAARELELAVLVEVHEESELERAVAAASEAIGVNSRDLRDFRIDASAARTMIRLLPEDCLRVAESGMRSPEDAAALLAVGYRGFLVGEALAASADPETRTREFAAALASAPAYGVSERIDP